MAKQKLFIPRKIEGEGSRWGEWNKEQPTKVIDGKEVRINQWDLDGKKQGYWEAFKKEPFIIEEGYYINDIKRLELSELNIISKLNKINDRLEEIVSINHQTHHFLFHNCVRFYLNGEQIAFKSCQMNIPQVGETIGIHFRGFVEPTVQNSFPKNYKLHKGDGDYYLFTVEDVSSFFWEWGDYEYEDRDQYEQYYVKLIPKLNPKKKSTKLRKQNKIYV